MLSDERRPPFLSAALLIIIGLSLLIGGGYLASLGGSLYYLITGLAVLAAGLLLWRGNPWGERLYALMLVGTLIWATMEGGDNPWALTARAFAPAVLGFWLAMPWVRRGLRGVTVLWRSEAGAAALLILAVLVFRFVQFDPPSVQSATASEANTSSAASATDENWPNYGNTLNGQRFSPLTQITPQNVADLKVAWVHHSGDIRGGSTEATPLKVGELLYTCTPRGLVIAIDAKTGVERWRYDSQASTEGFTVFTCRGVSYFHQPDHTGACAGRIIATSLDGKLHALDAEDGKPCADFGTGGEVSLLEGIGHVGVGQYYTTSPPTIAGGVAILGALVYDNQSTDMPSGVIRAYDVVTGQLRWAWDMGVPDRIGAPAEGETYTRSTPNSWMPFAADESLGLVYVPTGNPSPDFYGVTRRPFDEKYGSALVALDLANGRPKWSYQTTHHDLWDYDLPAQPVLADIPGADGNTPVVIQATKRGDIFVLDRRDGHLVVPAPEREVPTGALEGEALSKTQPISNLSLMPPPLTEASMWGATPLDMMMCRIQFRQSRYDGPFTPPGIKPTIQFPGPMGSIDWGGVSIDTDTQTLVTNTTDFPWIIQQLPRDKVPQVEGPKYAFSPQIGTPYVMRIVPFLGPLQMPCMQPPWGHLAAIDLKTNQLVWRHVLGTARDNGPFGKSLGPPLTIGVPNLGGTITTRSGLIFIAATLDRYFRAFDIKTGKELWRARLPAGAHATPMTYTVDGKQYVVISSGGHAILDAKAGDYTIAYALPETPK